MTQLTDIPFLPKLPATLGNLSIAGAVLLSVFVWLIGRKLIWGRPTLDIGEFSTKETNASDGARFTSLLEHSLMDLGRSRKGPGKDSHGIRANPRNHGEHQSDPAILPGMDKTD